MTIKLNEKYCDVEDPVQQLTDLTKVQYTSQTFFFILTEVKTYLLYMLDRKYPY